MHDRIAPYAVYVYIYSPRIRSYFPAIITLAAVTGFRIALHILLASQIHIIIWTQINMHVNTIESYTCRVCKPRVYLMRLIHYSCEFN